MEMWEAMNSLAERFAWGTGHKRKLCMVPSHSCYIYWDLVGQRDEGGGEVLKSSFGGYPQMGGSFMDES